MQPETILEAVVLFATDSPTDRQIARSPDRPLLAKTRFLQDRSKFLAALIV
ncbi:MAG: hypothetical protein WBA89_20775 [Microcoleus sp.]|uniref:hypothetical protein n=1 Tax=Microcoleus sp. TaxID=44472 RepID=UPI003C70C22C